MSCDSGRTIYQVAAGSASTASLFSPHGLLVRDWFDTDLEHLVRRGACLGKACHGGLSTKTHTPQESPARSPNRSPSTSITRTATPPPGQPRTSRSSISGSPPRSSLPTIPSERLLAIPLPRSKSHSEKTDSEGRPWNFDQRIAGRRLATSALSKRSLAKRGGCLGKICLDPGAEEHRFPAPRIRPPSTPIPITRMGGRVQPLGRTSPTQPLPGSVPVSPSGRRAEHSRQPSFNAGHAPFQAPFHAPGQIAMERSPTPFPRPASQASSIASGHSSPRLGGPVLPGSPRLQGLAASPGKVGDNPGNQSPPRTKSEQDIKDMLVPDAGPPKGSPPRTTLRGPTESAPLI